MAFNFSTPAQQPAFGATTFTNPAPAAATPFSFGTPASSANTSAPPTFSFGTSTPATSAPSFSFGTPASTPSTGFAIKPAAAPTFGGFGATSTAPTLGALGATSTAPTLGGFGATSAAPALGTFGATSTAPTLGGFKATSAAPTLGGFGATSMPSLGGFGTTSAAPPTSGFATSGFGIGTSSTGALTRLTTTASTSSAPSVGLGGINSTPFGGDLATSSAQGKTDSKAFSEMAVPNEIVQTVEEFKKFVKEQKTKKEEVSRGSNKALEKVGEEVESLKNVLFNLANNIQQYSALVHKLKHDAAVEIQNAEIAQRTKEAAPSLQLDNTAPLDYFNRLVTDFEQRMQFYRQQIEDTERNLSAMSKQHSLTPQELMGTMKKLHEAFVLLVGRVHTIHSALQNYKDDYLTYRRRVLGDSTDIFANKTGAGTTLTMVSHLNKIASGPSPFGGTSDPLSRTLTHLTSAVQQSGGPGLGVATGATINFPSSLTTSGGVLPSSNPLAHGFGTSSRPSGFFSSLPQTAMPATNTSFQLQSPPPGNKRNKR